MKKHYLNCLIALVLFFTASVLMYSCQKEPNQSDIDDVTQDSTQADIDKAAIVDYVQEQQLLGQFTDSGLYYVISENGINNHPNNTSVITVSYKCYLLNGVQIDFATYVTFNLDTTILGWQEGIQLIGSGGIIKLIIPSDLAYGSNGSGDIPANSVLVCDITLNYFTN